MSFDSKHTTGVLSTLAHCALWTLHLFVTMNRCHVGCCPQLVFQPVVVCLCEGLVGGCVERPPRPTAGCRLWMLRPGAMAPPWLQLRLRQPGQVRNTPWDANKSGSDSCETLLLKKFMKHVLIHVLNVLFISDTWEFYSNMAFRFFLQYRIFE